VHAPHVEVAKKLTKAGRPVARGDRVGYVIVKGPGKLYRRAEPYSKVSLNDVDYDSNVENHGLTGRQQDTKCPRRFGTGDRCWQKCASEALARAEGGEVG